MSVTITDVRTDGYGPMGDPIVQVVSPVKAAIRALFFELGYGGSIVESNATKITTHTRVFGCVDRVSFEGNIGPLRRCLPYWWASCRTNDDVVVPKDRFDKAIQTTAEVMIVGTSRLKLTVVALLTSEIKGLTVGTIAKQSLATLQAVLELHLETPLTLEDAAALIS